MRTPSGARLSGPAGIRSDNLDLDIVAFSAGGKVAEGPMGHMADQFWGDRCGTFTDPEGYTWTIATRKEDLTPAEMRQRMDEWMKQAAEEHAHSA